MSFSKESHPHLYVGKRYHLYINLRCFEDAAERKCPWISWMHFNHDNQYVVFNPHPPRKDRRGWWTLASKGYGLPDHRRYIVAATMEKYWMEQFNLNKITFSELEEYKLQLEYFMVRSKDRTEWAKQHPEVDLGGYHG